MSDIAKSFSALGDLIGGGLETAGEKAFQEGRYRSAQTEGALATARKNQLEALRMDSEMSERSRLNDRAASGEFDPMNAGPRDLWSAISSGLGSSFASVLSGQKDAQLVRGREEIMAPGTTPERTQQLRAGLGESQFDFLDSVGTGGAYIDQRHPELGVQNATAGSGELTPHLKDYLMTLPPEQRQAILAGGMTPEQQRAFQPYVRNDQFVNAGGVPTNVGFGGRGAPNAPVPTDQVATNAGAITNAKTMGVGLAKRQLDLPRARAGMAATNAKWDGLNNFASTLQADEGLWKAVGLGRPISSIPGTDGARLRAMINTLKVKVGFAVLQDLRDNAKTGGALGNISNQENVYLQNALAALSEDLAPEDFREQLQIVMDFAQGAKGRVLDAFNETYPEMAQGAPAAPGAAPAAPAAPAATPVATFATEAEAAVAEAAGKLRKGDRVTIGGQTGTWE